MKISENAKRILKSHLDEIDRYEFDALITEAITLDELDAVLDILFDIDVTVPIETISKCLNEHYIKKRTSLSANEKLKKEKSALHLINKYQIQLFKAL